MPGLIVVCCAGTVIVGSTVAGSKLVDAEVILEGESSALSACKPKCGIH